MHLVRDAHSFLLPLCCATLTPSTDNTDFRIAALAASAPFLVDTVLNTRFEVEFDYVEEEEAGTDTSPWVLYMYNVKTAGIDSDSLFQYIILYPCCVGWDALAGYTFARVARNYGEYYLPTHGALELLFSSYCL